MTRAVFKPKSDLLHARAAFLPGNTVALLKGSRQFFPALIAAIDAARHTVWIETYILSDDPYVQEVLDACKRAAKRGVQVQFTVDGFGSGDYGRHMLHALPVDGIQMRIFRPERWWRMSRRLLRRLHRKLAVIDDNLGFVGGINLLDDYADPNHGPLKEPRLDYCVQVSGSVVQPIHISMKRQWATLTLQDRIKHSFSAEPDDSESISSAPASAVVEGGTSVAFVPRDNVRFRRTIEHAYLEAIGKARHEVVLANAYFLPGRKLRRALAEAVRRGLKVRLLVQGRMEYWLQHHATQALYGQLLDAGIEINEYKASFLHAKVAVIDGQWATVGSSNIDPFSLLLAREANLVIRDKDFAAQLLASLEDEITLRSKRVERDAYIKRGLLIRAADWFAYGCTRIGIAITGARGNY
jgi:cardiolipin synthase A/B